MTHDSRQLAEALHQLAREADRSYGHSALDLPDSISGDDASFPQAVADFLEATTGYREGTKAINIGVY